MLVVTKYGSVELAFNLNTNRKLMLIILNSALGSYTAEHSKPRIYSSPPDIHKGKREEEEHKNIRT